MFEAGRGPEREPPRLQRVFLAGTSLFRINPAQAFFRNPGEDAAPVSRL
jgi:hypothetical protein